MNMQELTLLSEGQICGNHRESQLDVFKKYGTKAATTDLCVLTGSILDDNNLEDGSLKNRTGWYWTTTSDGDSFVRMVGTRGFMNSRYICERSGVIRPAFRSPKIFSQIVMNRMSGYGGIDEVEYGEYPQYAADSRLQVILEGEFKSGYIIETGKNYTFDSVKFNDYYAGFEAINYKEYEYLGKKYIRIKANSCFDGKKIKLSNGMEYRDGDYVWIEVSPVKWLIDDRTETLISKVGLLSGIRFWQERKKYKGDFSKTEMKKYLDKHMSKDLFENITLTNSTKLTQKEKEKMKLEQEKREKRGNPYGLNFKEVSEEQIIKGAIESGVAVFLHGQSSEGKSARVKQIDPTCEIIYLRNASPESLNGKSVYNAEKGEMIDVKPSWLKKLETKCEKEPDRYHIVFLDEITNALPSIQGIAFNIVLDREVNGIWKLPDNARIVAAGNDMKDSLAANQLAEPLFNRFAHVYIKITTESWLKWASEHNIHPAIYSYIAFKKGETLRSKYDGEKPNADPRKWEMASKMLYQTGSPEMLRALVGEDITKEFVQFCNQRVITLDDVINDIYTEVEIQSLNTAERYATTMGLSQANDEDLEKVREFVLKLGAEFVAIFDALWTHGDESKLERLAEVKLAESEVGGIRR